MRYSGIMEMAQQQVREACDVFMQNRNEDAFLQAMTALLRQRSVGKKVYGAAIESAAFYYDDVELLRLLVKVK